MFAVDLDKIDITGNAPETEPERQYYFMAKMREWVRGEEKRLGRPLTACTTTFGCPMVIVTQKCGNPLFI